MFWPTAIVKEENGKVYSMYTYESLSKYEDAKVYFRCLEKHLGVEILFSYIQDNDNNVIYLENNVQPVLDRCVEPQEKSSDRFYPTILLRDKGSNGDVVAMHTYDGLENLCDAKEYIHIIKRDFDTNEVILAYIKNGENVVYIENNIDAFGHIHYEDESKESSK